MFSTTPATFWCVWRGDRAGPLGHLRGGLLRGGDHAELAAGQQLRDRDGDVTGAGRQVQQQHVQVAPEDVGQDLQQRAVQHRAAPGRPPGRRGP